MKADYYYLPPLVKVVKQRSFRIIHKSSTVNLCRKVWKQSICTTGICHVYLESTLKLVTSNKSCATKSLIRNESSSTLLLKILILSEHEKFLLMPENINYFVKMQCRYALGKVTGGTPAIPCAINYIGELFTSKTEKAIED